MTNVEDLLIYKQHEPFIVKVNRLINDETENIALKSVCVVPLQEASNNLIRFPVMKTSKQIHYLRQFIILNRSLIPQLNDMNHTYFVIRIDKDMSLIRFVFYQAETFVTEISQQVPSNIVDVICIQRDPHYLLFLDNEGKLFTMNSSFNKLNEPMKLSHVPFEGKITRMNPMYDHECVLAAAYNEDDHLILIFDKGVNWLTNFDNSPLTVNDFCLYYLKDHPPVKFFDSGTVLLMNGELHHYNFRFRRNLGKRISEYVLNIDSPTYEEFLNNENCLIAREVKEFSVRMHIIASTTHDHIPDEIPDLEVEYSFGYLIDIRNNLWIWNNEYQCVEKNPRFLGSDFTGFSPERRPMLVKSSRS